MYNTRYFPNVEVKPLFGLTTEQLEYLPDKILRQIAIKYINHQIRVKKNSDIDYFGNKAMLLTLLASRQGKKLALPQACKYLIKQLKKIDKDKTGLNIYSAINGTNIGSNSSKSIELPKQCIIKIYSENATLGLYDDDGYIWTYSIFHVNDSTDQLSGLSNELYSKHISSHLNNEECDAANVLMDNAYIDEEILLYFMYSRGIEYTKSSIDILLYFIVGLIFSHYTMIKQLNDNFNKYQYRRTLYNKVFDNYPGMLYYCNYTAEPLINTIKQVSGKNVYNRP